MVLASHVIGGVYGFWLPNDPHGSRSDFVGAWELFRFGAATKVETRVSLAHPPHDGAVRWAAKEVLKFPAVHLTGVQARAVGRSFAVSAPKENNPVKEGKPRHPWSFVTRFHPNGVDS